MDPDLLKAKGIAPQEVRVKEENRITQKSSQTVLINGASQNTRLGKRKAPVQPASASVVIDIEEELERMERELVRVVLRHCLGYI